MNGLIKLLTNQVEIMLFSSLPFWPYIASSLLNLFENCRLRGSGVLDAYLLIISSLFSFGK